MARKRVTEEVKLEGIRMIWRNFQGEKKMYNDEGKRNFAIPLDEDIALDLKHLGWNVKGKERINDEGKTETLYHLGVTVKLDSKIPPTLFVIAMGADQKLKKTQLDEFTVGLIDYAQFDNVDVILRPFNYDFNGKQGVTCYLKTFFGVLHQDDLEKKYAHIPIEDAGGSLEIEAGDGVIDVEGTEWVEEDERKAIES